MTSETCVSEQHPVTISVNISYLREAKKLYCSEKGEEGLRYATPCSAGADLRADLESDDVVIPAGGRFAVPTGVAIAPSTNAVAGFVYSRSGLGTKRGLTVSQGVGVIDPDYRGEIFVSLLNTSGEDRIITRGERIAQLVFQPFYQAKFTEVDVLDSTERGAGGFGHSGSM